MGFLVWMIFLIIHIVEDQLGVFVLVLVKGFLKCMYVNDWQFSWFAVKALFFPTLERIEKEQHETLTCLHNRDTGIMATERRQVTETSAPCWAVLKLALVNIGEPQLASETPVSCCVCIRACMFIMHAFAYHWSNFYSSPGTYTSTHHPVWLTVSLSHEFWGKCECH